MLHEFVVTLLLIIAFLIVYIMPGKVDHWLTKKILRYTKRQIKRRLSLKRCIKNGRL